MKIFLKNGKKIVSKGWNSEEIVSSEKLDENMHWTKGFFWSSLYNWDGKEWKRNFHELRQRDLMLFALGEVEGRRVLDIGCGAAEYLIAIGRMGAEYVGGQDLAEDAVKRGRSRLSKENIEGKLVIGDAVKLDFPDNFFDIAFSSDFFEHISHEVKEKVISEVYRVLKPGGTFTIKTPNLRFLKLVIYLKRIHNLLRLKSPFIYVAHTRNNPDNVHYGLTTYSELKDLLEANFFHTPKTTYIPLIRKGIPRALTKLLYGRNTFTETIIITARKAIFYGYWE